MFTVLFKPFASACLICSSFVLHISCSPTAWFQVYVVREHRAVTGATREPSQAKCTQDHHRLYVMRKPQTWWCDNARVPTSIPPLIYTAYSAYETYNHGNGEGLVPGLSRFAIWGSSVIIARIGRNRTLRSP